jgi:signal transduction histidine kinase
MDSLNKDRPHYRSPEDLAHFESLNTPLWVFDVDRHAMWWANQSALVFWRVESLQALLDRDYSDDSETVRTRLRQVVESPTGPSRIQETWTLYPGGIPTTVITDQQPVLIGEGRHAILFEASRTLDLQEDPDALRILEVARSSALMVSSFTMSGRLLTQNPASLTCFGHPLSASSRSDLASRFIDETNAATILAAVEQEGHFEAELAVNTAEGERTHRVLARKGRDPVTGEFVTVLNEEDMTEQAELRRHLQQLNNELEQRVVERTERLQALNESLVREIKERQAAEEKLRHAQKMEAIGQLSGGIAHDFNNLLAVIMGNAELLKEEQGEGAERIGPILRAAQRGSELTQRLLAFSRRQPLQPKAIDSGTLISNMSDLLSRTLRESIEIEIAVSPDLWTAEADPGQVENAILNLVLNARDAMPAGGKLTIECHNASLDRAFVAENAETTVGDYVVIAVSDNGIGISPEVQERIFEPFFTTKEMGQGNGLGLAMVYGFAKQSGGHVSFQSEEGVGTTVELYLRRAEEEAPQASVVQEEEVLRGAGEVILVIEDDADVRTLVVNLLENLGYQVTDVPNVAAARRALAEGGPVDLVLSDVVLPGGASGLEFAKEARKADPDLKIVFMSGYPAAAAEHNGLLGSDQVLLNKPFQRRQLSKVLRDALD